MKQILQALALIVLTTLVQAADPLPSWQDGASRDRLLTFIAQTTDPAHENFVPVASRIATFDNDGTLWSEYPVYFQALFIFDRIQALAPENPQWREEEPFASVLRGEPEKALAGGEEALMELVAVTHGGMSEAEFARIVSRWLDTATHPKTGRKYTRMTYQPMVELLELLRENDYKTYIVSGGGIAFMRPFTESAYGIPPEQVIGSRVKLAWQDSGEQPALMRKPEIDFINDKAGKPVGIQQAIGKRPVIAVGNSDGDLQMLQWTTAGEGPRLGVIIHHTDAEREAAYDRESHIGRLDKALDEAPGRGWLVVDMKNDWRVVHPQ